MENLFKDIRLPDVSKKTVLHPYRRYLERFKKKDRIKELLVPLFSSHLYGRAYLIMPTA
jgi:hypothetical protein